MMMYYYDDDDTQKVKQHSHFDSMNSHNEHSTFFWVESPSKKSNG